MNRQQMIDALLDPRILGGLEILVRNEFGDQPASLVVVDGRAVIVRSQLVPAHAHPPTEQNGD